MNIIIHNILEDIAKAAYPDKRNQKFFIKLINEERKSFHGDWMPGKDGPNEIRIFNFNRGISQIIKTSIHELAHNMDNSIYKDTGHTKRFYEVYKNLVEVALGWGIIDEFKDSSTKDVKMMIKHHGEPNPRKDIGEYRPNEVILKVFNSYPIKDVLKEDGFRYNSLEKTWIKECKTEEVENYISNYKDKLDEENFVIMRYTEIDVKMQVKIILDGNTYSYKDEIKQMGYKYQDKKWYKKMELSEVKGEVERLKATKFINEIKVFQQNI